MDILAEFIVQLLAVLFGSEANKLGADREVPTWVKVLFGGLAVGFIGGVLLICWWLYE